jgi:hypothetical protein
VCGAGINCVGTRADGRVWRFQSLGRISGDWGGGNQLGYDMLWLAVRAEDGRGETEVRRSPAIVGARPAAQRRAHLVRVVEQQVTDPVRHLVHVIPPRTGHDHLFEHGQRRHGAQLAGSRCVGKFGGGVAVLPVPSLAPQCGRGRYQLFGRPRAATSFGGAGDRANSGNRDTEVRHLGLHVRLHLRRSRRFGSPLEFGQDLLDQVPVRLRSGHTAKRYQGSYV